MKYLSILFACILLFSCSKDQEIMDLPVQIESPDYYMNFDIVGSSYASEDQTLYSIESDQDLTIKASITEAPGGYPYHNSPYYNPVEEGKIRLLISLKFRSETQENFENTDWFFEFLVVEDLENINKLDDELFEYKSNSLLFEKMKLYKEENNFPLLLTMPDFQELSMGWELGVLSNVDFYFDEESYDIIELNYQSSEDKINMSGTFDVNLKVMSCGYYTFYEVRKANFNLLIE